MLVVVTRTPIKAIASVQRAGKGIQKTGVNSYNVPFVNMLLRLNLIFDLVSDGNNVFFILLI